MFNRLLEMILAAVVILALAFGAVWTFTDAMSTDTTLPIVTHRVTAGR